MGPGDGPALEHQNICRQKKPDSQNDAKDDAEYDGTNGKRGTQPGRNVKANDERFGEALTPYHLFIRSELKKLYYSAIK